MNDAGERFPLFVAREKARNTKRLRFALFMAALIGALLWRTEWIVLRPGLAILLAGQFGVGLLLLFRNASHSRFMSAESTSFDRDRIAGWFAAERGFISRLALFENSLRIAGFAILGYEFWLATRNILISLLTGLLYPATAYFGMAHRSYLNSLRQLEQEKEEVLACLRN